MGGFWESSHLHRKSFGFPLLDIRVSFHNCFLKQISMNIKRKFGKAIAPDQWISTFLIYYY